MRKALLAAVFLLAAPGAFSQDIEALERQLDQAREAAPMTIRNFMLVKRKANHFGDYEARPGNVVAKGEEMHFYAEPRNLVPKLEAGVYVLALEVDIEVAAAGKVQKQPKFMSVKIPSRSRVQDLFLNLTVSLGGAPPGDYEIKFVVRDVNSKKSAAVAKKVTLK